MTTSSGREHPWNWIGLPGAETCASLKNDDVTSGEVPGIMGAAVDGTEFNFGDR